MQLKKGNYLEVILAGGGGGAWMAQLVKHLTLGFWFWL